LKVEDALYSFALDGEWAEVASGEPGLSAIRSRDERLQLTASGVPLTIAPQQLEAFAHKFVELRLKGEAEAAQKAGLSKLRVARPQVVARPWGYAVAYYGSDDRGRHSRFSGAITGGAVISIYAEALAGTPADAESAMNAVLATLQFDRTPLSPAAAA
jgi:hypothetical protein